MPESEVNIVLRTEADTRGIVELSDAVKKEIAAERIHVQELKNYAKSLDGVTASKGRLLNGIRALLQQFPLLARATGLLANPITAAITLATIAYTTFKKWEKSINEASEAAQALARFKDTFHGIAVAQNALKRAAEDHAEAMRKLAQSQHAVGDKMDRELAIAKKLAEARKELLKVEQEISGISTEGRKAEVERGLSDAQIIAFTRAQQGYREQIQAAQLALPGARVEAQKFSELSLVARKAYDLEKDSKDRRRRDELKIIADRRQAEAERAAQRVRDLERFEAAGTAGLTDITARRSQYLEEVGAAYPYQARAEALRAQAEQPYSTMEDLQSLRQIDAMTRTRARGLASELRGAGYSRNDIYFIVRDQLGLNNQSAGQLNELRYMLNELKSQVENQR